MSAQTSLKEYLPGSSSSGLSGGRGPTAGQNRVKYGCTLVTSLVASDTHVRVTCTDRPPIAVAWPRGW